MQMQLVDVDQQLSDTRQNLGPKLEIENTQLERSGNDAEERVSFLLDCVEDSVDAYRRSTRLDVENGAVGESPSAMSSYYGTRPDTRNSAAIDSRSTELDALRTHWENTNKNYRLSSTFDFEKTPTSTEGGELSGSLAMWRQRLQQEESEATASRGESRGEASGGLRAQQNHL